MYLAKELLVTIYDRADVEAGFPGVPLGEMKVVANSSPEAADTVRDAMFPGETIKRLSSPSRDFGYLFGLSNGVVLSIESSPGSYLGDIHKGRERERQRNLEGY